MASSQSGETIGTVRSALHEAISQQTAYLSQATGSRFTSAFAARDACEALDRELALTGTHVIVNQLQLKVPQAAAWLPSSIKSLIGKEMRLGAAIREVAKASAKAPASPRALPNFGQLLERVREAHSRSSSQAPSRSPRGSMDINAETSTHHDATLELETPQLTLEQQRSIVQSRVASFQQSIDTRKRQSEQEKELKELNFQ